MDKTPALEIIVERGKLSVQEEVRYQLRPYELLRMIMINKIPIRVTYKRKDNDYNVPDKFIYWRE